MGKKNPNKTTERKGFTHDLIHEGLHRHDSNEGVRHSCFSWQHVKNGSFLDIFFLIPLREAGSKHDIMHTKAWQQTGCVAVLHHCTCLVLCCSNSCVLSVYTSRVRLKKNQSEKEQKCPLTHKLHTDGRGVVCREAARCESCGFGTGH